MPVLSILLVLFISAKALPTLGDTVAERCDPGKCFPPECRCSSTDIPGGFGSDEVPQFVLLTFDSPISSQYMQYFRDALYQRTNPNGCPAIATFFVDHQFTDYSLLHELHANGMEISLHSITNNYSSEYWKNASVETLRREFAEQRDLISKFGLIPKEDMKGIRMPMFQMAGNNQYEMLNDNNILYDFTWPTVWYAEPGLWPYSLAYRSTQDCPTGPCPDKAFPGAWVLPTIAWKDSTGTECSSINACVNIPDNFNDLINWIINEFNKQYRGNRAPFSFNLQPSWFQGNENHWEAYKFFLDYLQSLPDVFIVSSSQVIDWVKNPVDVFDMIEEDTECKQLYTPTCRPKPCRLQMETGELRDMVQCDSQCPKSYPWLGNPLGEKAV